MGSLARGYADIPCGHVEVIAVYHGRLHSFSGYSFMLCIEIVNQNHHAGVFGGLVILEVGQHVHLRGCMQNPTSPLSMQSSAAGMTLECGNPPPRYCLPARRTTSVMLYLSHFYTDKQRTSFKRPCNSCVPPIYRTPSSYGVQHA